MVFVETLHSLLPFMLNAAIKEFQMQCFVIYRFQQSPIQFAMNFHCSTDNLIHQIFIYLWIHSFMMIYPRGIH